MFKEEGNLERHATNLVLDIQCPNVCSFTLNHPKKKEKIVEAEFHVFVEKKIPLLRSSHTYLIKIYQVSYNLTQ